MKKFISILLALITIISLFTVITSAVGPRNEAPARKAVTQNPQTGDYLYVLVATASLLTVFIVASVVMKKNKKEQ